MTRHLLNKYDAKEVRDTLNRSIEIAETARHLHCDLIEVLRVIDKKRFYVRYGHRSLAGFCRRALRLSRLHAQSLVIEVRRGGEPWRPPSDQEVEFDTVDGVAVTKPESAFNDESASDKMAASFWPF